MKLGRRYHGETDTYILGPLTYLWYYARMHQPLLPQSQYISIIPDFRKDSRYIFASFDLS